jgi:hypothetical protein
MKGNDNEKITLHDVGDYAGIRSGHGRLRQEEDHNHEAGRTQ